MHITIKSKLFRGNVRSSSTEGDGGGISVNSRNTGIRPLSGTSSFSNDTARFTNFFIYNGDRICLNKSIIWANTLHPKHVAVRYCLLLSDF